MTNTLIRAMLLGSALTLATGALAQEHNPSGEAPVANTGSTATSGTRAEDLKGQFVEKLEPNHMMGSTLMGATIMGADNQRIGTVDDILLDQDGKVAAVTTDVGGFIGIGAKTIAIPVGSFQFVTAEAPAGNKPENNQQPGTGQNPAGIGGSQPPAGGDVTASTTPAPKQGGTDAASGGPKIQGQTGNLDHIQVTYSREQLRNAPEFTEAE
jgi:sporulation protein YlmC with PRC-barrel domain